MRKEGKLESMQGRKKGWMHLGADLLGADLQLLEALAKAAVWGQWCVIPPNGTGFWLERYYK